MQMYQPSTDFTHCQVVSWDDVSRGTVGGSLSCWGANITDTYLKSKNLGSHADSKPTASIILTPSWFEIISFHSWYIMAPCFASVRPFPNHCHSPSSSKIRTQITKATSSSWNYLSIWEFGGRSAHGVNITSPSAVFWVFAIENLQKHPCWILRFAGKTFANMCILMLSASVTISLL